MILKASQRAGGRQLAAHLLNDRDNEHVTVQQIRGFVADDLHGALQEAFAVSRATKCTQYLFSLSINPPKGALTAEADFIVAADEAERRLGLVGQPRAIVFHEKNGRRHAHVVWSRIDADTMRAINLPHFKRKLTAFSKELFLAHEWPLPEGLRTMGGKSPLNFTLDEWQQAKRQGIDPREIKDAVRDCWQRSDSLKALAHALEDRGYFLARGDRRGFVFIDTEGEVHSLARFAGLRVQDLRDKLGEPDNLPSVDERIRDLRLTNSRQVTTFISDVKKRHAHEIVEAQKPMKIAVQAQRQDRGELVRTHKARWDDETRVRASRFRRGLVGLWDSVTGRKRQTRQENEREAEACRARDAKERAALVTAQFARRLPMQAVIDQTRVRHVNERRVLARQLADHRRRLMRNATAAFPDDQNMTRRRERRGGMSLDL